MSTSLFELFKELSITEQAEIQEYMLFRRQRVAYLKNKIRALSPEEEEQFAQLIAPITRSDEESDKQSFIESKLDKPLDDIPDYVYIGHCSLCTCHLNDDCACERNHDHFYGDIEDLDRDLNRITFMHKMDRGDRILPPVPRVSLRIPQPSPPRVSLRIPQPSPRCLIFPQRTKHDYK